MTLESDFPKLVDTAFKTFIGDGNSIGFEVQTANGPVRFSVDPGQLPLVIGKIFTAATEAQKRRGETSSFENLLGDIRMNSAIMNPKIYVANSIGPAGQGRVGVVMEISGIPFTGALRPEECLKLADQLQTAAEDQSKHSQRKPS